MIEMVGVVADQGGHARQGVAGRGSDRLAGQIVAARAAPGIRRLTRRP